MTDRADTPAPMDLPQPSPTEPDAGPPLRIHLLGQVAALGPGGRPIDVGPAKCQVLLAALALSPGAAVPVDRLVTLVWGDDPPRTAAKTLQSYATQLRKGLGADRVVRAGAAYRLDVDHDAVDVGRFERRLDGGDVAGALAEWGGPPLAGIDPAGLAGTVAGLVERWLGAVEAELERAVDADPGAAIGRLTELTASHPFREGLWALLMTALYATGRQAEALAAYRRARATLVDQLGVEPGPRLRRLEAQILDQDAELHPRVGPDPPVDPPPSGTVTFAVSEVEGSTRLWTEDRAATTGAIARHEEIVVAAALANRGHVFATGGDSFGIAFHRAGDAARWADEVQAAIGAEPWPDRVPIRVRIGINTGEAEERHGNYFGAPVNLASRVAGAGHGGQTLVTAITAALLAGHALRNLGSFRLDGSSDEQVVWQLGPGDHPPLRVEGVRDGNLPRPTGRLIGRDELLETTIEAVRASPLVTLVGPGGIGKTRLGLAAARQAASELDWPAWLVELADITSPDDVTRAVADQLDLKELPGRTLLESVVVSLRRRRAVVLLDNCEHVVDGAAEFAAAVTGHDLGGAGEAGDGLDRIRVVTTSREGLGLDDEQIVVVGPLDADRAAVELFNQRASAVDRSFDPDADRAAVTEICRRLDGVPLAIELAAARVRTLPPADLVKRLDDSFRVLTGGRRRSVERHRTLRTTIEWSNDLLSPAERAAFRRLSVFTGSFDLAAAEAVLPDDPSAPGGTPATITREEVNGLLGDLVERSMVVTESGANGRRFRLLEIMRQFGAEQLADLEGVGPVAARHAANVADEVARCAQQLGDWRELDGAARLAELWPNLRAAFDWAEANGDVELAIRLVDPIAFQALIRRGVGEIGDWAKRLLEMGDPGDDEAIALGLLWSAFHHATTHDRAAHTELERRYGLPDDVRARAAHLAAVEDTGDSLDLTPGLTAEFERRGERILADLFAIFTAGALLGVGRLDDAAAAAERLADRFRVTGPATFANYATYLRAATADFRGDTERADALYAEALDIQVPPRTNGPNDVLRARAAFRQGRHAEAFEVLRVYAIDILEVDNMSAAGLLGLEFTNMMAASGQLQEAARILGYLDRTGMLDVEGPAFRMLVLDASQAVDADPDAARIRRSVAGDEGVDDRWGIEQIVAILDRLLDRRL